MSEHCNLSGCSVVDPHYHTTKGIEFSRMELIGVIAERDAYKSMCERLADYCAHDAWNCILAQCSAGEPTPDGGYRTMFAHKWYQTKPIDETPKCTCGLSDIFAAYAKLMEGRP